MSRLLVPATPLLAGVALLAGLFAGSPTVTPGVPSTPSLDLLSSAHPTGARPAASDTAYGVTRALGPTVDADAAALTSATCDGCAGESTTLQVVYGWRARRAGLDNVATAWAQQCAGCTAIALSVQVVVLPGDRTRIEPNNRALATTAGCERCATTAVAFQVVLAGPGASMSASELADLRTWVDLQAAALRASVVLPDDVAPTPSPTAQPTSQPTTKPTPTEAPPTPPTSRAQVRRDATSALGDLERLLASSLGAETVSADVDVSR